MARISANATLGDLVPQYTYAAGTVSQIGTVHLIAAPGTASRLTIDYAKIQLSGATTTAGTVQFGTAVVDDSDYQRYSAWSFGAANDAQAMRLPANTAFVFSAAGTSLYKWSARYYAESI